MIVKDLQILCLYFNSIKVRLEHRTFQDKRFGHHNFNSIKVRLELVVLLSKDKLCEYFNSIKVRLEHEHEPNQIDAYQISIP